MHSAVYEGFVSHHRLTPVDHAFRYAHAMLYLDLAELPRGLRLSPAVVGAGRAGAGAL